MGGKYESTVGIGDTSDGGSRAWFPCKEGRTLVLNFPGSNQKL